MKATSPPTIVGISTVQFVVNVAFVIVSVMVITRVGPSYVICTWNGSPLCRSTPELVISTAGVVGDAPFVYSPVESGPSPLLLYRSNFTATLLGIPPVPPGRSGPYPNPPPDGP